MLDAFRERKLEVIEALGNLGEVARSIGAASLAARVDLDLVKKLESDRFHLVVVGEFNHGKSTFVNALLGNAALPIGVTPTTAVIHHIVWSDEPCAKVVLASGQEQPLPFEDVKSFATVAALRPDIVVMTGDWISYRRRTQLESFDRLIASFPHGQFATIGILGNHDYGTNWRMPAVAEAITTRAEAHGVRMLRNEAAVVEGLTIIGLEDLWGPATPMAGSASRRSCHHRSFRWRIRATPQARSPCVANGDSISVAASAI